MFFHVIADPTMPPGSALMSTSAVHIRKIILPDGKELRTDLIVPPGSVVGIKGATTHDSSKNS